MKKKNTIIEVLYKVLDTMWHLLGVAMALVCAGIVMAFVGKITGNHGIALAGLIVFCLGDVMALVPVTANLFFWFHGACICGPQRIL